MTIFTIAVIGIGIVLITQGLYEVCDFFYHSCKYEPRYTAKNAKHQPRL